jgi:hypothetical protein
VTQLPDEWDPTSFDHEHAKTRVAWRKAIRLLPKPPEFAAIYMAMTNVEICERYAVNSSDIGRARQVLRLPLKERRSVVVEAESKPAATEIDLDALARAIVNELPIDLLAEEIARRMLSGNPNIADEIARRVAVKISGSSQPLVSSNGRRV